MVVVATAGNNRAGQLGRSGPYDTFEIVAIDAELTQVSCGKHHCVVVTNLGACFGWGRNSEGQLGFGIEERNVFLPRRLNVTPRDPPLLVIKVAAGDGHTMVLTQDGEIYVVGSGSCGQLGNGTCTTSSPLPVQVHIPEPVVDIASASRTCFAITAGGSVYAWGESVSGIFGMPNVPVPCVLMPMKLNIGIGRTKVDRVVAADEYAIFITSTHDALGTGSNSHGQMIGVETDTPMSSWRHVKYPCKVRSVATGLNHIVSLLMSGKVIQSGGPTNTTVLCDDSLCDCAGVAAGRNTSFCWSYEGRLFACGRNNDGQLGINHDVKDVSTLQRVNVPAGYSVVFVSCGSSHTALLLSEGELEPSSLFVMEDQGESSDDMKSNPRWDEDISNVSFSRAKERPRIALASHGPITSANGDQSLAPNGTTSKELQNHDAFRNTKIVAITACACAIMLAIGFSLARWRKK